MELTTFLIIIWLVGFVATGMFYFVPRLILPYDQYCIPAIVAIFWPIGLPLYLLVAWLKRTNFGRGE
jgi:hypothetical protein